MSMLLSHEDASILETHRERWLEEQRQIASQVVIRPDVNTAQDETAAVNSRFRLLPFSRFLCLHSEQKKANEQHAQQDRHTLLFGGVDVSFDPDDASSAVAVYVVMECDYEKASSSVPKLVYQDHEYFDVHDNPYIPSFLAVREIAPLKRLITKQRQEHPQYTPCTILVDGNGVFHPRRAGLACFVGVQTGLSAIGIGKNLLGMGGLTKAYVSLGIDAALQDAVEYCKSRDNDKALLAGRKSGGEKCISMNVLFDSRPIRPPDSEEEAATGPATNQTSLSLDRGQLMKELSTQCGGLTVPLQCSVNGKHETVAMALVGHGGRLLSSMGQGNPRRRASCGSKNPIFVSVGHAISLECAVGIAAALSLAKIPEPVRQADLIGRDLLRKRKQRLRELSET